MPKFDTANELAPEPVEFDFTGWGVKASGVIPEPTPTQIRDFMRTHVKINEDFKARLAKLDPDHALLAMDDAVDISVIEDTIRRVALVPEAEYQAVEDATNAMYAALCSNKPSAAQIAKLQSAPRTMFFRYVENNFLGPQLRLKGTPQSPSPEESSGDGSSTSSV